MSELIEDDARYFALIAECAKQVATDMPEGTDPAAFWLVRIRAEWLKTLALLNQPSAAFYRWEIASYSKAVATTLGELARETLMAIWWLAQQGEEGDDDPENIEFSLVENLKSNGSGT